MYSVIHRDGAWHICIRGDILATEGPFTTSAEAWRRVDRLEGSPISPAEKRSDYVVDKILKGE